MGRAKFSRRRPDFLRASSSFQGKRTLRARALALAGRGLLCPTFLFLLETHSGHREALSLAPLARSPLQM